MPTTMRLGLLSLFVLASLLALCGCALSSKWAMDNPAYADKYGQPYDDDHWDKWSRMGKQMVDARHIRQQSGIYFSLGGGDHESTGVIGAELGVAGYSHSWLSGRLGLLGMLHSETNPNWLAGVNGGLQISPPTRLAPYVGVGGLLGAGTRSDDRDQNGVDDDFDGVVDDSDEEGIASAAFLAAVYPEVGVNYWINGSTRLHAGASYWFNTLGRTHDFWYYSVGLTFCFGPGSSSSRSDDRGRSEDEWLNRLPRDWKPEDDRPAADAAETPAEPNAEM